MKGYNGGFQSRATMVRKATFNGDISGVGTQTKVTDMSRYVSRWRLKRSTETHWELGHSASDGNELDDILSSYLRSTKTLGVGTQTQVTTMHRYVQ